MTHRTPIVTTHSGVVVSSHSHTLTEVTGQSHVIGGEGTGHISTRHVDVSTGQIIRYSDGYEISFKLEMQPFLRQGEPAALLYAKGKLIGAAKLKTSVALEAGFR